ncbi:CPBP family intramembrane metalloprotease [Natrinema thermotolerans]|uniref:CPBP family intramembrane metalloprotease n=1 Tax=Natrinema thermotolerans TaxID=121872 RepID=A0AAF0PBJ0_9EURY|nr:type II CAAX endopeptidase family protein [Natrinema thermotolerans]QCC60476.1 CPBP family intramembrane metalloprotease [Natrinema thermotolerans]QCC61376.1 CPBP family intramembrane metalloprotease [Natrinema thermotolerans]WMT07510.1 CPBP family intramembrane metalloprotease [Natrinema thermotolerans]WMT08142.1 CPBP family intramembrane metalloprotease [Natrinema thermotolerans]
MNQSDPIRTVGVVVAGWVALEVTLRWGFVLAGAAAGIDPGLVDAFVLALGFPLIAAVLSRYALERGQDRETWGWGWGWSRRTVGAGALAGIVGLGLVAGASQVDAALFGLGDGSGTGDETTVAAAILLLVGNGFVVPIAEEQVWRGVVQTELVEARGAVAGIAVTAVLFAFKHVIVDLSVVRLTTLLTLAALLCVVRYRWNTVSSTVAHVVVNAALTVTLVATTLG